MKPTRLLIIGAVLGLAAVAMLHLYVGSIESDQKKHQFFALKPGVSLAAGQTLERSMLQVVSLPEGFESLMAYALPAKPETMEWLIDSRVSKDVPEGSFLLHEHLMQDDPVERFAATVEPGMRAVTIPVNPRTAVAYFIEPGSRVDVLATMEVTERVYEDVEIPQAANSELAGAAKVQRARKEKRVITKTILQNVKILAVDRATTRGNYMEIGERGFNTVTVEVSPIDSEKIVFAIDEAAGELTLVLRNPEDATTEEIAQVEWSSID